MALKESEYVASCFCSKSACFLIGNRSLGNMQEPVFFEYLGDCFHFSGEK